MKENLDDILKRVLTPTEEPGDILNGEILRLVKEREHMRQKKYKRMSAAVIAAAVLAASSLTAFAAWQYRSADSVAERLGDQKLAEAFEAQESEQAPTGEEPFGKGLDEITGESQSFGGYQVTLLGVISGSDISKYERMHNGEIREDRMYCVVAIRKEDGTPVNAEKEHFFVSPLIGGLNPGLYNAVTLCGNYGEFVEDGILYRLLECDNIEYFADQKLYLCVSDTDFYSTDLYDYREADGTISRNTAYEGLNALFELKLDASKADAEKAKALIEEIGSVKEAPEVELPGEAQDAMAWAEKLTPENIEQYCVRMENTVQTMTPDAEGYIVQESWLVNEKVSDTAGGGGGRFHVKYIFEEGYEGLVIAGYGCSEEGLKDLVIDTYTRNEDGTVTFAAYVPKEVSRYLQE